MTLASKITLVRVAFIPLFMVLMYLSGGVAGLWMWLALATFIIASITDYIDGHIARKYDQVSDFRNAYLQSKGKNAIFGCYDRIDPGICSDRSSSNCSRQGTCDCCCVERKDQDGMHNGWSLRYDGVYKPDRCRPCCNCVDRIVNGLLRC